MLDLVLVINFFHEISRDVHKYQLQAPYIQSETIILPKTENVVVVLMPGE